jgi:hypothetical protein
VSGERGNCVYDTLEKSVRVGAGHTFSRLL